MIWATRSPKTPLHYSRATYRARNVVERLWCRLKDWRRVATGYDKLARNYMAGVLLTTLLTYWR